MYTKICLRHKLRTFWRKFGANISLQLSWRTHFAQIKNKRVMAEDQCEKHKKSSLVDYLVKINKKSYFNNKDILKAIPASSLKFCQLIEVDE